MSHHLIEEKKTPMKFFRINLLLYFLLALVIIKCTSNQSSEYVRELAQKKLVDNADFFREYYTNFVKLNSVEELENGETKLNIKFRNTTKTYLCYIKDVNIYPLEKLKGYEIYESFDKDIISAGEVIFVFKDSHGKSTISVPAILSKKNTDWIFKAKHWGGYNGLLKIVKAAFEQHLGIKYSSF